VSRIVVRPGRPKDSAKHAAIVAAATELFARAAYEAVSMEMVANQAGVSKMTVYSHFTDKETLFETVVLSITDRLLSSFQSPAHLDGPLQERLTSLGVAFLTIVLEGDCAALSHRLPAAMGGNQALAQRFFDAGPGRIKAALSEIVADAASAGLLAVDCTRWVVDDLISLWQGDLPARITFGLADPVKPDDIVSRARRGTKVFLRAYGVDGR
jgi:TetR/AcrR family transcriptional repressor of mexJK operon